MRKYSFKVLIMLIVCLLCSCSKEGQNEVDVGEKTNVVSLNDTRYDVYYSWCSAPLTSAPSSDEYFGINLALEKSEHPGKSLYLSCVNYIYGEKVDLTTSKYNSSISFCDGKQTYSFEGGSSKIESGSYYVLTRAGDRISVTIHIVYREHNNFVYNLDVNYAETLIGNDYLPEEDWQNKPRTRYNYIQDGVSYMFSNWARVQVDKGVTTFSCSAFEKGNREATWSQFDITVKNLELGKKIDLSSRNYFSWCSLVAFENVLPGSYMYVTLGKNDYEVTIDLLYKDSNGASHHLLIEYNVYK